MSDTLALLMKTAAVRADAIRVMEAVAKLAYDAQVFALNEIEATLRKAWFKAENERHIKT